MDAGGHIRAKVGTCRFSCALVGIGDNSSPLARDEWARVDAGLGVARFNTIEHGWAR